MGQKVRILFIPQTAKFIYCFTHPIPIMLLAIILNYINPKLRGCSLHRFQFGLSFLRTYLCCLSHRRRLCNFLSSQLFRYNGNFCIRDHHRRALYSTCSNLILFFCTQIFGACTTEDVCAISIVSSCTNIFLFGTSMYQIVNANLWEYVGSTS